ncbi:hypothetical protein C3L33_13342, partial [Rhododendron williamsianum]
MNTMRRQQDEQSRVFCELSALILNILRSPPAPIHFADHSPAPPAPVRFSDHPPAPVNRRRPSTPPISPAGFASLLLGISLALMLCGSVTFFIGFMLMPWVLGLVMFFYVVGIVSSLSMIGRAILCHTAASPPSPRKEVPVFEFTACGSHLLGNSCEVRSEVFRRCVGRFNRGIAILLEEMFRAFLRNAAGTVDNLFLYELLKHVDMLNFLK